MLDLQQPQMWDVPLVIGRKYVWKCPVTVSSGTEAGFFDIIRYDERKTSI